MLVQKQEVTENFVSCSTFQAVFCLKYVYINIKVYIVTWENQSFFLCFATRKKQEKNET